VYEYEHQEAYPKAFDDSTAADDEPADGDVDGRLRRFEERMKQQDKVVSYKDMQVAIFRFAACSRFHARLGTRSRPRLPMHPLPLAFGTCLSLGSSCSPRSRCSLH
jgi:hypothetical protein